MIVVDFETTGLLDPSSMDWQTQPGIVQIGLIFVDGKGESFEEVSLLLNPDKPVWDPDAIATHGIKPEDVKDKPTFSEIFSDLTHYFMGSTYWIGYNNPFDKGVLWHQLLRYGLARNFPWPPMDCDVMQYGTTHMNIKGRKDTKPPTLGELYFELEGKPLLGAHDALTDCRGTATCLRHLIEKGVISLS